MSKRASRVISAEENLRWNSVDGEPVGRLSISFSRNYENRI